MVNIEYMYYLLVLLTLLIVSYLKVMLSLKVAVIVIMRFVQEA